ncbi:MAG: hypothetical protein P8O83_00750, partial [Flavobacteriaceae bacterium]|nr:hypothetical protein [Flavobacteriaceae bacterium]
MKHYANTLNGGFYEIKPTHTNGKSNEQTLAVHPRFFHLQGTKKAKGVIIWSPGHSYDRKKPHPNTHNSSPPHFIDWLYANGWDIFFINRRGSDLSIDRDFHALEILNAAETLKDAGYENIVVAGQSAGAIYSTYATYHSDWKVNPGVKIYGAIIIAHGMEKALFNNYLKSFITPRLVLINLKNDLIVGQHDKIKLQEALKTRKNPTLNIFETEDFEGH